ncbi:DUF2057 domain-containing protein [Moraxella bovis]|uniref:DUF2057 domain-containing protein n=1 Tax=Moraxella bovis TaxID=476 RepID=UPI000DC7E582|nr:DUF2057 domain-containing protein [Moraxella bovis]AWY20365.1 DUF2057 domain-containing protein [Moraxella bovis]UYZ67395.1 DUF2057 domain-containing protein [Moraxella bovis]UYZ69759.1 DUF2057 domain-containing protein [Moraxella bovis]UYZ74324.1 DUF2057 domain-containing protein [Moraxella bovis]UYZ82394.1 DUF2057 domain-containing protein [Moraxella bovis]
MKKLSLLLALALATPAFAEVRLNVDEHIKVTAINGQEIKHGALQPLKREFTLDAGRHVITARYDRLFDLPRGEHDYLKSGNVTITADLADNQTYQLVMPNQPSNYRDAKEYAKAPTLAISQNGKVLASEQTVESRTGILSTLGDSIGGLFGRDDATRANQKAIAALNQTPTQPTAPTMVAPKDNLDGFMQLWLNATPEEREKIRQWVEK